MFPGLDGVSRSPDDDDPDDPCDSKDSKTKKEEEPKRKSSTSSGGNSDLRKSTESEEERESADKRRRRFMDASAELFARGPAVVARLHLLYEDMKLNRVREELYKGSEQQSVR